MKFLEGLYKSLIGSAILSLILGSLYGVVQGILMLIDAFGTGIIHLAWVPVFCFMGYIIGSVYADKKKFRLKYPKTEPPKVRRKTDRVA